MKEAAESRIHSSPVELSAFKAATEPFTFTVGFTSLYM
jgi:hypothetical protein